MKPISVPHNYNYIAVFLTLSCNLKCRYCINHFGKFKFNGKIISGKDWVRGLNRIISYDDLPLTLEGGEPSLHPDFYYIINNIKSELGIDILTNLQFDVNDFIEKVKPERLKRNSPYASIRVSYHPEEMNLDETINKILRLLNAGYSVGIWGFLHPNYEKIVLDAKEKCIRLGIDFRIKEFLGKLNNKLYGTYKYLDACEKKFQKMVECKNSELIIGSDGYIYRCHSDLYKNREPIGHILDPEFNIEDKFRDCKYFGFCNPCDVKIKTNRLQVYGHTSVEIKFK